jgi:hypothetical protein
VKGLPRYLCRSLCIPGQRSGGIHESVELSVMYQYVEPAIEPIGGLVGGHSE